MWEVLYDLVYRARVTSSYRTETETADRMETAGLFHSSIVVAVSLLVSALTADIFSTFCDGFMVQCVKLLG